MNHKKKILILGGTKFIGRNLVETLIHRSEFEITLFNRNTTNPGLFKNVRLIKGDRDNKQDIEQIGNEEWDTVIDLSGYFPRYLEKMLPVIEKKVNKIIFVSSVVAYEIAIDSKNLTETDAPKVCPTDLMNDESWSSYGFRKAACERIIQQSCISNKIILRPAIAYGEEDLLDRFYYWMYKIKFQNEIIIPESGRDVANYTYVKDLAAIIHHLISCEFKNEIFNVTTHDPLSLYEILQTMIQCSQTSPTLFSIPPSFLIDNSLVPRVDIPLWNNGDHFSFNNSKIKKILPFLFSNFEESIYNTVDFYKSKGWRMYSNDFLSVEKEKELIQQYKNLKTL